MEKKDNLKDLAVEMALRVGFLTTREEPDSVFIRPVPCDGVGKDGKIKKGASPHDQANSCTRL